MHPFGALEVTASWPQRDVKDVGCPWCEVLPGVVCMNSHVVAPDFHEERKRKARRAPAKK